MDRRRFLWTAGGVAGATSLGLAAFYRLGRRSIAPESGSASAPGGYGPLQPAGAALLLPQGFRYTALGEEGTPMSDGRTTPAMHDGSGTFLLPNGHVRLIRNHEVGRRPDSDPPTARAYDPLAGGGTTSLEIDPATNEIVRSFLSLDGTMRNCAGGVTPWGSWLSCEENVNGAREGMRDHGYVFEVPATAEEPVAPVPLKAMGRFIHEAVAVDPGTGIVYLTEDQRRAGFYRFRPDRPHTGEAPADLAAGGRLEMLAVTGQPEYDAAQGQRVGASLPVSWVPIADPDPAAANTNPSAVFEQGWNLGGARFSRIEGAWWGEGSIWVTCTDGGDAQQGQVWRYVPRSAERGELILAYESPGAEVLNNPDNICVSPRGGLVICEDGDGHQFLRGLTREGVLFDLARNVATEDEWAGATFSPDGTTLFVNTQGNGRGRPGVTYAIRGPWEQGGL